ncbi:MAG TPA: hypothetical protein VGO45_13420 [Bacteroidia bacterium]|nr:hypothetical protein [Bacteroidia bacterium]
MASFKDKLQVFFLGLLLGLLLGGGFFLFKLDQFVKELSIYKSFTRSNEQTVSRDDRKEDPQSIQGTAKSRPGNTFYSNPPLPRKDTAATKANLFRSQQAADSTKVTDSLNTAQAGKAEEDIVLRKDQLLSTRNLEEINISPVAVNPSAARDSLAAKMAGVRDEHAGAHQFESVEFWSSPLNYRGYKMNRNKLVLYGFSEPELVRLFKLDDEIYLHTGSVVYRLDYTNDFRPYERVTSDVILSKLK